MHMQKRREKAKAQMEDLKSKIVNENQIKSNITNKFSAHYDAVEDQLKSSTVGLLTLSEMKEKQEILIQEREKQIVTSAEARLRKKQEAKKKEKRQKNKSTLSFAFDEDEEEEEE